MEFIIAFLHLTEFYRSHANIQERQIEQKSRGQQVAFDLIYLHEL